MQTDMAGAKHVLFVSILLFTGLQFDEYLPKIGFCLTKRFNPTFYRITIRC